VVERRPRILFVTGRLAEAALRDVLAELEARVGFEAVVQVMPISVAALMPPRWIARHLEVPQGIERIVVPGHCPGDLELIERAARGVPVERGPQDLRDLPRFFGQADTRREGYGAFSIEILAEINHAPRLERAALIAEADRYRREGADVIDLGCTPGETWAGVGDAVRALRDAGHRVSIDSFDAEEVAQAVKAGAELVLSVNGTNRAAAPDWGVEVVAIPDRPGTLEGLEETAEFLASRGVPFRLDPILEPIGFGFAASLSRYAEVRRRHPNAAMLMGVGNLTELTDVDSAGINVVLAGFCEELGIGSVLTTAVIGWARSSVAELDRARRLMHHAVTRRTLPKHLEPELILLRDPEVPRFGRAALEAMAARVKDPNWRLYAEDGVLYAFNNERFLVDSDPFMLFERMGVDDPSHAFYLGYELAKARTALTLGKAYRQDEALRWGFLTEPEESHLERRRGASDAGAE
jgi:dihydropteroate synthase